MTSLSNKNNAQFGLSGSFNISINHWQVPSFAKLHGQHFCCQNSRMPLLDFTAVVLQPVARILHPELQSLLRCKRLCACICQTTVTRANSNQVHKAICDMVWGAGVCCSNRKKTIGQP